MSLGFLSSGMQKYVLLYLKSMSKCMLMYLPDAWPNWTLCFVDSLRVAWVSWWKGASPRRGLYFYSFEPQHMADNGSCCWSTSRGSRLNRSVRPLLLLLPCFGSCLLSFLSSNNTKIASLATSRVRVAPLGMQSCELQYSDLVRGIRSIAQY